VADVQGPPIAIDRRGELAFGLGPIFTKLRPGPGLSAEEVLSDQRRRLHGAVIALVDGDGWNGLRVRNLVQTAGVSTATFYKHFANADECLASAFDAAMSEALDRSADAQRRRVHWRDSLGAAVEVLMETFARDPQVARVALLDVFSAGLGARRRIGFAIAELERLVATSFQTAPKPVTAPRHLIAGMTAGMMRLARKTTMAGRGEELPGLANELCEWMTSLPHPEVVSLQLTTGNGSQRREPRPLPAVEDRIGGGEHGDRERLLRAVLKLASARGLSGLTASRVRTEAGVSRRRFDAEFADLDTCFLDAVEAAVGRAAARSVEWSSDAEDWTLRTCRTVQAICAQGARDRRLARLAFLEIFGAGRDGLVRREHLVGRAAAALRVTVPAEIRPSALTAEASVAAAWHIAQAEVAAGRARQLPQIAPLFSYVLLAPVVGAGEAAAAIQRAGSAEIAVAS
jgi:AcrR family transcriptional regulator